MNVERTIIPDVLLLTPPRFLDARGFFSETWNERRFAEAGVPGPFIQDNHARSAERGVVRGLHLQIAPSAQGKLVRVVRGSIWDVAVDIRPERNDAPRNSCGDAGPITIAAVEYMALMQDDVLALPVLADILDQGLELSVLDQRKQVRQRMKIDSATRIKFNGLRL